MANELNIALPTSGLTVTAQPYQSGSAVGSAISLTEVGSSGFYSGDMIGSAGTYQLAFVSAGANVGSGSIVWSGTAEVASSAPSVVQIRQEMDSNSTKLANLDAAVSTRSTLTTGDIPSADITAIKAKTDNLPAAPAAASDIPASDITAIKAKTDLLNTDRLANVATTNIVGTLLSQAHS
jgi:hypothetical protein